MNLALNDKSLCTMSVEYLGNVKQISYAPEGAWYL